MSCGDICQLGDVTETQGALHFPLAPENNPGIVSKTVDVSLYKEGNSFGFVLRGQCESRPRAGAGKRLILILCVFCFALMNLCIHLIYHRYLASDFKEPFSQVSNGKFC